MRLLAFAAVASGLSQLVSLSSPLSAQLIAAGACAANLGGEHTPKLPEQALSVEGLAPPWVHKMAPCDAAGKQFFFSYWGPALGINALWY